MINIFLKRIRGNHNKEDINIDEANSIIKTNSNSVLLDVRSPLEYSEGHLNRCNKYTVI